MIAWQKKSFIGLFVFNYNAMKDDFRETTENIAKSLTWNK